MKLCKKAQFEKKGWMCIKRQKNALCSFYEGMKGDNMKVEQI